MITLERQAREAEGDAAMLLTFRLEGELFALPVEQVHEILDPMEPTAVPLAPSHAPALVNVRGVIVPLFDIRQRLRIRPREVGPGGRVVVIEAALGAGTGKLAILADSVEAVIEADLGAFQPLPALGSNWPEDFVAGGAQLGGELVVLLNAETLFDPAPGNASAA